MIGVELERASKRADRRFIVAESVLRISDASNRLRRIRNLLDSRLEEFLGRLEEFGAVAQRRFSEQRATDLQHEVDVVGIPEFESAVEAPRGGVILAELQECLAKSRQSIFVLWLEDERLLE